MASILKMTSYCKLLRNMSLPYEALLTICGSILPLKKERGRKDIQMPSLLLGRTEKADSLAMYLYTLTMPISPLSLMSNEACLFHFALFICTKIELDLVGLYS